MKHVEDAAFAQAISVEQMRKSDAYTIAHFVPSKLLMFRAAMGVFESVCWHGKIAILAGGGNNGGDGYALAGILALRGFQVQVYRVSEKLSLDGAHYYERALALGVPIQPLTEQTDLQQHDILVDCILGTGFCGVPRGLAAAAIDRINASGAYVVSVDINSGLNGDTGEAVQAVHSDLTVSIGFYKKGLFLKDAPRYIKKLVNVDIGIVLTEP